MSAPFVRGVQTSKRKTSIDLVVSAAGNVSRNRVAFGGAVMLLRRLLAAAVLVCLLLVGTGIGLMTAAPAPSSVRVSYLQRIISLDPHGTAGAERMSWIIGRHLYNQLVSWDYSAKKFQPQLALGWRNIDPTT